MTTEVLKRPVEEENAEILGHRSWSGWGESERATVAWESFCSLTLGIEKVPKSSPVGTLEGKDKLLP